MKAVVAVITLALGLVLGMAAAFFIGVPDRLGDPTGVLEQQPPAACADIAAAAQRLADVNEGYVALVRDTYLPLVEQAYESGFKDGSRPGHGRQEPIVAELSVADEDLTALNDESAAAGETLRQAQAACAQESSR